MKQSKQIITYEDESSAMLAASALNAEASAETHYKVSRYQEKYAVERQKRHSYWSFDEFVGIASSN